MVPLINKPSGNIIKKNNPISAPLSSLSVISLSAELVSGILINYRHDLTS